MTWRPQSPHGKAVKALLEGGPKTFRDIREAVPEVSPVTLSKLVSRAARVGYLRYHKPTRVYLINYDPLAPVKKDLQAILTTGAANPDDALSALTDTLTRVIEQLPERRQGPAAYAVQCALDERWSLAFMDVRK